MKSKEAQRLYNKAYKIRNRDRLALLTKEWQLNVRKRVLSYYSNGTMVCKCCGEREYKFLSLDHINGGGSQHRKQYGSKYLYSWTIQNKFPGGYQVLCHNCNMAKGFYKVCPHQAEREILNEETNVQQETGC